MLTEMWEETGTKPPALESRPQLKQRWVIPHEVWRELSGSRNYTPGGLAEIPFSEFFLWAWAHDYTKSEMQSMWEDVHIIDVAWLEEQAKVQEAERATKKAESPAPNTQKVRV